MGRQDGLSGCCAFCLCPVDLIPEKTKQDTTRKLILEKFYTEFINNPIFYHSKFKKNGAREEDKPADNWTVCGECEPHVNRLLGSKAKVDKVENEVRELQRRVVEEMRGLLKEVDGMCGDMVMIEGILSNRDVNSDAATGRGMRGKCREFKDRVVNILEGLRNFQQEVGDKLVPSEVQRVKIKKIIKGTAIKSLKVKTRTNPVLPGKPKPEINKIAPLTTTTKPKIEDEIKLEVVEEPAGEDEEDNDRDSWHWSGNDGDNGNDDDPQSPELNPSADASIPSAKVTTVSDMKCKEKRKSKSHLYHSKKKKATMTTPNPKPAKVNKAPAPYQDECNNNDDHDICHGNDDGPLSPGQHEAPELIPANQTKETMKIIVEDQGIPAKRARRSRIQIRQDSKEKEDDFSFSSDSSSDRDSSSDEYDPEDEAYKDVPAHKFRKNLISRIGLRNTISTSGCLPSDDSDPRRPYRFRYIQTTNKFFVNDFEVDCLDFLEENSNEPALGCTQCDYAIHPSKMHHPRDNIEDYIFEHILGKHLKVYNCATCGKDSNNWNRWREHQRTHVDVEALSCDICGRPMAKPAAIKFHRWTHFSQAEKEDPVNEHWMPLRVKKPNIERNFVCEICGKGFKRKSSLQYHENIHKNEEEREKIICERCGHTVIALYYNIHKNKHCKPPRDLRCHICGDGVKNVKGLEEHLARVHPDEKSYECDVCGSKFKTTRLLRHHKETHEQGEKYLCKGCGKGFKQRLNCWRHEKICGALGARKGGGGERKRRPGRQKAYEEMGGGEGEQLQEENAGYQ